MYLSDGLPLNAVLQQVQPRPNEPLPAEAIRWTQHSLLDDLVASGRIADEDALQWSPRTVKDLWHEGVCASMLARLPGDLSVEVPLAHASALAGIMLATQVMVANDPGLSRRRAAYPEARIDIARPLPQVLGRPRQPHPTCLCRDQAFVDAWRMRQPT